MASAPVVFRSFAGDASSAGKPRNEIIFHGSNPTPVRAKDE